MRDKRSLSTLLPIDEPASRQLTTSAPFDQRREVSYPASGFQARGSILHGREQRLQEHPAAAGVGLLRAGYPNGASCGPGPTVILPLEGRGSRHRNSG